MNTQQDPHCPCCGHGTLQDLGSLPDSHWFAGRALTQNLPGGRLYRCTNCWLKFRYPTCSDSIYEQLYNNASTSSWSDEGARPDWDLILEQIHRFSPRTGRVLDFGCYTGGLLTRLDASHEKYGVELNHEAAQVASERSKSRIWSRIDDAPVDLRFDVIVMADVVEHMADPKKLIDQLSSRLAEHGSIIITTGDADNTLWNRFGANWWYCYYPEHITFLSERWLHSVLRPNGWRILRCETFAYRRLGLLRRVLESTLAWAYGLFPRTFLAVGNALKSMLGRYFLHRAMTSVPGNGASADHLLVVLTRDSAS